MSTAAVDKVTALYPAIMLYAVEDGVLIGQRRPVSMDVALADAQRFEVVACLGHFIVVQLVEPI